MVIYDYFTIIYGTTPSYGRTTLRNPQFTETHFTEAHFTERTLRNLTLRKAQITETQVTDTENAEAHFTEDKTRSGRHFQSNSRELEGV